MTKLEDEARGPMRACSACRAPRAPYTATYPGDDWVRAVCDECHDSFVADGATVEAVR